MQEAGLRSYADVNNFLNKVNNYNKAFNYDFWNFEKRNSNYSKIIKKRSTYYRNFEIRNLGKKKLISPFLYIKPTFPYKNFKHKHIERPVHPVFGITHHANRKVRNEIDKTEFFKDILEIKPDAFICL